MWKDAIVKHDTLASRLFFFPPFYFQKAVREKRDQPVKHNKNRSPPKRMKFKKKKTVEEKQRMTMIYTTARIFWCCSTSESFPQMGQNEWQNMLFFRIRQRRF